MIYTKIYKTTRDRYRASIHTANGQVIARTEPFATAMMLFVSLKWLKEMYGSEENDKEWFDNQIEKLNKHS